MVVPVYETSSAEQAQWILTDAGVRLIVVENEAGESSIDHELLAASQPKMLEGVLVLQNGCICCTATGSGMSDLERVIDQLLR